ncbi:TolB amino-terminal domain-containing protein [Enhydrobacter aerosaccus]|uniref:TolB amino-terminal domain-containing protein n=1 Tax=Enhydrobacter aerosaccus TaxID=225324 RepID=A0A1T4SV84_9HYPH|nr:adenylate/guanylate cyclase domain-containing protein [Enhydrobacter aerosaccus]SKA32077.1 TolB amino-terminal domain-containing protein [Enhydrobacter aerosaccus]
MAREQQRRLAAILFADAVGSSQLMGRDESGTVARLLDHLNRRLAPTVARRGGRVIRLKGDGGLIEFVSAVDAVAAAIDFQRTMAEVNRDEPQDKAIVFRVALHLGDVIVDGDDIYGDDVNVAARLESQAPPGGIIISHTLGEAIDGRIKATLHPMGELSLKNIVRPIRAFRVEWKPEDWPVSAATATPTPDATPAPRPSASSRLSIVVLPFANIGGDPEHEYFVDGVTESLTTDLSRMSGTLVIARNTAFTYKGKSVDVTHIGRELQVRYALQGSVQRGGNRLRVNVQLVDTANGSHLWAERFDKPIGDLLDMQDEVVARLARQLGTQLIGAEARRAERAPNPDSVDLYFQGMAWLNKGNTPDYLTEARRYFERALTLDPGNIEALVWSAYVDVFMASLYAAEDREARLAAGEAALVEALTQAPEHAWAHLSLGLAQIQTRRAAQGIAECERALAIDRNLAPAHAMIGLAKFRIGRGEETEAHVEEALRLSPRDPFVPAWLSIAGDAKLLLGKDEEAVSLFGRAIALNRNNPYTHFLLAAALANLDRIAEAKAALQAGLALNPKFTMRRYLAGAASDHPTFLAQRDRVADGLRKAGAPEG